MGLGMFVMGSLGETVCHGGLSAMAIQVWQSNIWVKYIVMSGMVVEVCPRIAWVVACFPWWLKRNGYAGLAGWHGCNGLT